MSDKHPLVDWENAVAYTSQQGIHIPKFFVIGLVIICVLMILTELCL